MRIAALPTTKWEAGRNDLEILDLLRTVSERQKGFEQAKRLYSDRLAPEFNPFDFIAPNEIKLSRILAWLLIPKGNHGQDARFLRLLLDAVSKPTWPPGTAQGAETKTEVSMEGGRIDIQVRSGNRILAIENKPWPWSGDTEGQFSRYFRYLEGQRLTDYDLIYLTTDGSEPTSIGSDQRQQLIDDGQLHLWSYRGEFMHWLAKCRSACRADRVTIFIDHFLSYLREQFEGSRDMTTQDHLVDQVTQSSETVSAAMQVVFAADAIRERLLLKLHSEISEEAAKRQRQLEWEMSYPNRFSGLVIRFSSEYPWGFCLEFQSSGFNQLIYGIYRPDETLPIDRNTGTAIENAFGSGQSNQHWIWHRPASAQDDVLPLESNWGSSGRPWVAMADGSLSKIVVAAADRFHALLLSTRT